MLLERLDIRGYRRLRGSFEFDPQLTLVTGPNEAGKSTLHDALIHALFGFSSEERLRRGGSSEKDARMPWAGGPFGVTLHARDREERAVLAVWDFATDLAVLQDADTGEQLQREQPRQRADHQLGRRLVGMTRAEFTQVCCLHQEALATVRPTEELRASLQRSIESAPAEEIGVQSADERLRKLLSRLGVHSATYRETRDGELQRLNVREHALGQELDTARAQRVELDGLVVDLDRARERRVQLAGRHRQLAQRMAELQRAHLQAAAEREQAALRAHVQELELRRTHDTGLLVAALVVAAIAAIGAAIFSPVLAALLLGAAALAWAARPRPSRETERASPHEAPPESPPVVDPESPQSDLVGLEAQLRGTDTQITQLQTMIGEREAGLADPADLEVELAEAHTRRERVELERDATRIAREALRVAAQDTHRRVAPHLNEALRRELPRITRGRYAEGAVDEDLAIRLYAPEHGSLVSVEELSRGTRDQVALVQRLEIARLLDPTAGRAPLLLDDPFAHFDPERLRLGAELIAEVAERRQVILLTDDPEVVRRIRAARPSCALIELPDPILQGLGSPDMLARVLA